MKYKHIMQSVLALTLVLVCSSVGLASEQTASEEAKLDAKLGILDKPFVVNLSMLETRTALREAANVRTGLPAYDQQVENAQGAPASLLADLTKPLPVAIPVAPKKKGGSSSKKDEPEDNDKPDCFVDQNGQLICK